MNYWKSYHCNIDTLVTGKGKSKLLPSMTNRNTSLETGKRDRESKRRLLVLLNRFHSTKQPALAQL